MGLTSGSRGTTAVLKEETEHTATQPYGQRDRNTTICFAISQVVGLVHHIIQMGGMNGESFNNFLINISQHLDVHGIHNLIFDGASAHFRAEATIANENPNEKMLPPYSPFLYKVDQTIRCLKANIKPDLSSPELQNLMGDRNSARNAQLPLREYRGQLLVAAARRNLGSITVPKCAAWFRLTQTYLSRCLAGDMIEG